MEKVDRIIASPFFEAAQYWFWLGALLYVLFLFFRNKMQLKDMVPVLFGSKPVHGGGPWLYVYYFVWFGGVVVLTLLAMEVI